MEHELLSRALEKMKRCPFCGHDVTIRRIGKGKTADYVGICENCGTVAQVLESIGQISFNVPESLPPEFIETIKKYPIANPTKGKS